MTRIDEIKEHIETERNHGFHTPLIWAIEESGFSIDEVCRLITLPESLFYKILLRLETPTNDLMARLSVVLNKPVEQLFPEIEA